MQNTVNEAYIKEIFTSIQGEGLYVGEKQIFVRFCKCNLACRYCDTDFSLKNAKKYLDSELFDFIYSKNADVVSFTGGEPLMEVNFLYNFLKKYKEKLNKKIYLETNGTIYKQLAKIIDFVDVVSMDIKLKSATGEENKFYDNEKFLDIANQKEIFIKVVFDNNITVDEINSCIGLAKKHCNYIVLQPKMPISSALEFEKIYDKFYKKYKNIRLIPQTHKFLNFL